LLSSSHCQKGDRKSSTERLKKAMVAAEELGMKETLISKEQWDNMHLWRLKKH